MSKYIYFTPEEKARARNTDLVSLLCAQGRTTRALRPGVPHSQRSQYHRAGQQVVRPLQARGRLCRQLRSALLPVSLIRRRFCFCWAERMENRMSRQSPQRSHRSPSHCRSLTEPCGACMPISCASATSTGRSSPISHMISCSTRTRITLRFRWSGWQRRGETRPHPQHQQRGPGVPHEH